MKVISFEKREPDGGQRFHFQCPACDCGHFFIIGGKCSWSWNGDAENPTVKPSIRTWQGNKKDSDYSQCHSFITDGKIKYCGDCTHDMKGQTVELPDWL